MADIMNLALRRNLFYPSNEIYPNSPAGFYDYGPYGVKIRNKIVDFWRKHLVEELNGIEIDGCQILPESVFKASGHLESFFDPVVKCSKCGSFYRVDKLLEKVNITVGEKTDLKELDKLLAENKVKCEKCKSFFEKAFHFNMMYKVNIGVGDGNPAYLRPEACQNIFLDFLRIYKNARRDLPLAVCQIGKAFRNEIAPKNGLIRVREMTQMDIEMFFDPDKKDDFPTKEFENLELPVYLLDQKKEVEFIKIKDLYNSSLTKKKQEKIKFGVEAFLLAKEYEFFKKLGFKEKEMRFREVSKDDRAFYSLATWDFEVKTEELGWVELVANNYRTDHDLKGHAKGSGTSLEIMSGEKKVLPHVFEISMGTDRVTYTLLANSLEGLNEKLVLKLNKEIMPYSCSIFPLMDKDGLGEKAQKIYKELREQGFEVIYDEKGSIGKRYARVDEIGVRYAFTIDYDTLEKDTVTVRDAWTTKQERIKISEIKEWLKKK